MSENIMARLGAVDTGALSDALDRLGRTGAVLGLARLSGEGKVVGRAVTVQLGDFGGEVPDRHLCTAAVEASDTDSVIVVANRGRTEAASWGGILSVAAHGRGVAGIVIDGATRDLDEVRDLGLRLHARTSVQVSARGRFVEVDWNVPVEIAGVDVRPGDYVVADSSGVVVVEAAHVAEVLKTAEQIAIRERVMEEAVRAGEPITAVMGKRYESMTEQVG
ncbi:RraA family protein [Nocardia sp. NPDC004278]|uniref:RraA family protein n=1 Tax=Nocardia sp. NPDC004604 TaxID=3157013 RepID=UPI0033ADD9C7